MTARPLDASLRIGLIIMRSQHVAKPHARGKPRMWAVPLPSGAHRRRRRFLAQQQVRWQRAAATVAHGEITRRVSERASAQGSRRGADTARTEARKGVWVELLQSRQPATEPWFPLHPVFRACRPRLRAAQTSRVVQVRVDLVNNVVRDRS